MVTFFSMLSFSERRSGKSEKTLRLSERWWVYKTRAVDRFANSLATRRKCVVFALVAVLTCVVNGMAYSQDDAPAFRDAVKAIQSVGKEGDGFEAARLAAEQLRRLPIDRVTLLLDGMNDINPISENWFRGVTFDVVRKADQLPVDLIRNYAMDQARNPAGRGLAMELLRDQSPEIAEALIGQCLEDPSLPLREMAVEQWIERAEKTAKSDKSSGMTLYRQALSAARHPKQVARIVAALEKLGDDVTVAEAFAMITDWHSLAPLNNVDGVGFDQAFPVEVKFAANATIDFDAIHDGKSGKIQWQPIANSGKEGKVDLAAAYDKEKGAVGFLYTVFESSQARQVQARLGCINANKVWINGVLVMSNEVYHSGSMIDQYTAQASLNKGLNHILLKICQNEQTEPWAQEWEFQFRITDLAGKSLRSGD